jgi:hypothetical protein
MPITIEARAYGPDSSPEEAQAIRERVYLLEGDIILYREMPVQSQFHLDLFEAKLNELTAQRQGFAILLDLTEAQSPSAETRERLRQIFSALAKGNKMRAVAVFTGKNFLLNIAAKFVLHGMGVKLSTVHRTKEEAISVLREGS